MSVATHRKSTSLADVSRLSANGKEKPGDVNMNDVVNEHGEISLTVVLPDRQVKVMDVKYNMPMMDLLVQVASNNRLKPGEHVISVISEETGRTMDYQSSQTIGSLSVNRIFLINKSMQKKQRESEMQRQRDMSKFEQTVRVTINMPRGVKSVQRLNPHQPIMDIFRKICLEKNLDASRYEVQLTKKANTTVDMSLSLSDYSLNEITIVQCSDSNSCEQVPDYHTSMVDISRVGTSTLPPYSAAKMADPFEKVKKKKGLFSFLRKDKSKSMVEESNWDEVDIPKAWKKVDEIRSQSAQTAAVNGDASLPRKPQAQVRPQPKVQATIPEDTELDDVTRNKATRAPSKKKYRAPAPPSRPLSTMGTISEEKKTTIQYTSTPNLASTPTISASKPADKAGKARQHAGKSAKMPIDAQRHSRNSSDSSGYHEPPTTPPESASSPSTSDASTLPRPVKRASNIELAVQKPRPASAIVQRSQTLPGAVASKKQTKKKAAPPPPPTAKAPVVKAAAPSLTLHDKIVESEDETSSLNSPTDDAPEIGILSFSSKPTPPPIFVPPPPPQSPPPSPQSPPPPAVSKSPHRETLVLSSESPSSVLTDPPSNQATPQGRSDSRCSRASVDTIDDVQQYFDLAIAAGESQLRHEQGVVSPANVAPPIDSPSANEEVAKLAKEMTTLTANIEKEEVVKVKERAEPTQDDVDAAVAHLNMSIGDDDGSDGSLVPDGENFVVAASKLPSGGNIGGSIKSTKSQSGYVKPVEEISYGFDNPFRAALQTGSVEDEQAPGLVSSDSQISDSTLPDSEHTDRPQSSSLQSSSLHSDEDESVTETGDGYETASTEKVSQSEAEASMKDVVDSPATTATVKAKKGLFQEVKGHDVNRAIYGDKDKGSVRGIPGQDSEEDQVKTRAASFTTKGPAERVAVLPTARKTEQARPKSVFAILRTQKGLTAEPAKTLPASSTQAKATAVSSDTVSKDSATTSALYTRPLPVYDRMNSDKTNSLASPSPTSSEPVALASVIADSVKSGEAAKSMRKAPETASKPMFFKAARNSRVDASTTPDKIENVVKLDTLKYDVKGVAATQASDSNTSSQATVKKSPPPTAAKPTKPGATLSRKESLKEQYNKLQENMAKWQGKLKDNESRVKELTTSQQNLSTAGLQLESKPVSGGMVKSTSSSAAFSTRPFAAKDDSHSVPSELQKTHHDQVTLRATSYRVIQKVEPELDPVESLMKSIRDRAGRISDTGPDRGIYVATGGADAVPQSIAKREVAPTLASAQSDVRISSNNKPNQAKMVNGVSRANDPRFNPPPSTRDSLLAEIANAGGRPTTRRPLADSSSSQSSSDELKEIKVRHKPQKTHKHKTSKRSISDPFPPQGPGSNGHIQPSPTELDPREELMIAIRTSGGLSKLRQVNADEIKWSAQV